MRLPESGFTSNGYFVSLIMIYDLKSLAFPEALSNSNFFRLNSSKASMQLIDAPTHQALSNPRVVQVYLGRPSGEKDAEDWTARVDESGQVWILKR